ncbi:hypothetical protein ASG67_15635 [Sphingomonas sp. Leaf339]|uniref:hypothetical protein n=1 Tax=Sphingomonas sp. Leaf339 TaxID=1736343 RepID=UPI0006F59DEA|nr:hypothetical protein [Sphingomonas sp. Leaf339]KQU46035.1 hypothetical protein ASG67_15635 [Sphingomonas sp. Leaf339]
MIARAARWNLVALAGAVAMIVIVSLSIHVVMLQVFWVPYPEAKNLGIWGCSIHSSNHWALSRWRRLPCRGCIAFTP